MPQARVAEIWPEGRECAVSLTYDGATRSQLKDAVPLLDSLGIGATFFASPTRLLDEPLAWQRVTESHEIANHSLFGITDGGTLLNWTCEMVEADVRVTNKLISEIIGQVCDSVALPGWSTACADGDYLPSLQRTFAFVRSERREENHWAKCDFGYLGSFPVEHVDPAKLITAARKKGSWVVFRVQDPDDREKHDRLVKSLAAARESVWVAPFGEVARRLESLRQSELLNS